MSSNSFNLLNANIIDFKKQPHCMIIARNNLNNDSESAGSYGRFGSQRNIFLLLRFTRPSPPYIPLFFSKVNSISSYNLYSIAACGLTSYLRYTVPYLFNYINERATEHLPIVRFSVNRNISTHEPLGQYLNMFFGALLTNRMMTVRTY
jgi:hypothetical protein